MTDKKTVDRAAAKMLAKAQRDGIETVWDRYQAQQPQCGFGELGVCCRNCMQGPCRINPFGEPKKGVCGATADVIVARNLLRTITGGAASHVDHAYDVLEALELAGAGTINYPIKGEDKLLTLAGALGIDSAGKTINQLALEVAAAAREDFGRSRKEPMRWLTARAPKERVEKWTELGIIPANPDLEIRTAMHQSTMGMDADPVNLLLASAKLGLVDGYAGLYLGTDLQDVIFGVPQPVESEANLGVLQKNKVNLVVHGHVPLLSEKIVEWAQKLEPEAIAAGAEGIQVSGVCCTGNEVLMRQGVPAATNFLGQELAVITGAVDLMVVDVQCIMPSLASVAACYHTKLVTTMPIVKIPGAEHVPFELETADDNARTIVRMAIEAYSRRDHSRVDIPADKEKLIAGFSVEAIVQALSKVNAEDPLKPLVDNIKNGNILGAVGTVGCNNVKVTQDYMHIEMVKELLKNNVLVVATGCSAHALAKAGFLSPEGTERYAGEGLKAVLTAVGEAAGLGGPLPPVLHMGSCVDNSRIGDLLSALAGYLGVAVHQLPVAASAPEPQHEKAVSIGTWAVALGVYTHLGVVPPVLGSQKVTGVLTSGLKDLLQGSFYVETDPIKAAHGLIDHIKAKRQALGI